MEYTRVAAVDVPVADVQRHVRVANLTDWCASIVKVHSKDSNQGRITCLSGDFVVHRELLNRGVRFSIPAGPHVVRLLPALNLQRTEAETGLNLIESVLAALQ